MKSLMDLGFYMADTIFIDVNPIRKELTRLISYSQIKHAIEQTRSQPLNSILITPFRGDPEDCA